MLLWGRVWQGFGDDDDVGGSHVGAGAEVSAGQHLGRLPLLQLSGVGGGGGPARRLAAVGGAQTPQFGRQVTTHQDAARAHVAMHAPPAVQVLLRHTSCT